MRFFSRKKEKKTSQEPSVERREIVEDWSHRLSEVDAWKREGNIDVLVNVAIGGKGGERFQTAISRALCNLIDSGESVVDRFLNQFGPEIASDIEARNQKIAFALSRIGSRAVEPLINSIEEKEPFYLDYHSRSAGGAKRKYSAMALGMIGDSRALPVIRNACESEDASLRAGAQWALANWNA